MSVKQQLASIGNKALTTLNHMTARQKQIAGAVVLIFVLALTFTSSPSMPSDDTVRYLIKQELESSDSSTTIKVDRLSIDMCEPVEDTKYQAAAKCQVTYQLIADVKFSSIGKSNRTRLPEETSSYYIEQRKNDKWVATLSFD
jgi:hypothetical protein